MAGKRIELEQPILLELNRCLYTLRSMSFYLEFTEGKNQYRETFSGLILTPEELETLCDEVDSSNLRRVKSIKYYCEGEKLPFVVMI